MAERLVPLEPDYASTSSSSPICPYSSFLPFPSLLFLLMRCIKIVNRSGLTSAYVFGCFIQCTPFSPNARNLPLLHVQPGRLSSLRKDHLKSWSSFLHLKHATGSPPRVYFSVKRRLFFFNSSVFFFFCCLEYFYSSTLGCV